jgi:sarcosine oxidase, subunit alpha
MSGGWSPVVHLWSHCGGKLTWDETLSAFLPRPRPPADQPRRQAAGGSRGLRLLGDLCYKRTHRGATYAGCQTPVIRPMPQGAGAPLRAKMWLDYQNDVKVSDVELAAREGYESVEHTKRYTTLGMATDQGKTQQHQRSGRPC